MLTPGRFSKENLPAGVGGFVENVSNAAERIQEPDSIICDFCSGKRFPLKDKRLHSNV